MFDNILVPVDGSDYSNNAVKKAVAIAEKYDSNITLLHVISHSQIANIVPPQTLPVVTEEMLEGLTQVGKEILEEAHKIIGPKKLNVSVELAWGSPAQVILEKANSKPYDLIIIGSRGRGGISGLLLGSVSDRVAHLASCPVMIVKDK
ncbi:MAG: universal stress protein [Syntrophomonadaceae bacterium]|nr:universal stress protein [Syntrophomonadaceae bacterium]